MQELKELLSDFNINGNILSITPITNGLINTSLLIEVDSNNKTKKYILQKINNYVFNKPDKVMDNIFSVTNFIKNKLKNEGKNTKRSVMKFYKTNDNKNYTIDQNGNYWRLSRYIRNSITYNETSNLKVLEETGKAFGSFQNLLSDYPINNLNIIIPHFHNTVNRYKLFKKALSLDYANRAYMIEPEINAFLELENIATKMYKMQKNGDLRLRVTHNDTKCNNVLFDKDTHEYLCAIDLDTVMPGLIGFDFGDAIRFCANTCAEDEQELSKVKLDFNKFEAFTKGFLSQTSHSLTENEKNTLALGAVTITIELGLRFLTDYLNGDQYFKIQYRHHNLDRARCQLTLAKDMIKNLDKMNEIVNNYYTEYENI